MGETLSSAGEDERIDIKKSRPTKIFFIRTCHNL
jgi:hypothetical protein